MSNTSTSNDKTVVDNDEVKLIIGEIGRDTKTGIIGRGYSFDNGNTFHVTDTIYGRLYTQNDADGLWNNGLHEKVKEKVNQEITNTVEPAIKQADSAVAYANDAIEKSRVNSQAIVDINSAVSDAVSDAAVARSDGLRAWNAAQSNVDMIDLNYASASAAISSARTEAIAAADEAKASASAAQADIVAARSDVAAVQADVTATRSDVATAKNDIVKAKSDATAGINAVRSDVAAAKSDIVKAKSDATGTKQTLTNAKSDIAVLQSRADGFDVKYANTAGDIDQIKADAKGMTQTISNAQGDIAKLKIRADGFDTQFSSTNGDINKLQTDASGTKQTLTNAKSDIAVLQSRADGFDAKYADTAGDINTLKVDAKGFNQTLTNAKGDISTLQATATGFKNTLTDAQGNISTLQSDVAGLKKTTSDHAGNIATLQADAKTLTSQMSSAQGDISTLKQTASGFSSKVSGIETSLANANSKLNNLVTSSRNYIQNSESIIMTPNGTDYYDLVWYVYNDAFASNTYCHGNNKTRFSFYLTPSKALSTARTFRIYWRTSPYVSFGTITVPANTTDTQYYELAITTPTSQPIASQIFIRFMAQDTSDISYTITKSMLTISDSFPDWQPAPEDTDAKITTNSTAIEQNKKAIALKADQTTVDKTNGTVQQLQSDFKVQADKIESKVSSSDLQNLVGKGGRNLLIGSDPTLSNKPILGGVTEVNIDGVKAWHSNNADNIFFNISLEANTTYTYSALIKTDTAGELGFLRYGHFQVKNPNSLNKVDPTHEDIVEKRDYHGINVPANQWTRIYYTFTTNELVGSKFGVFPSHANGHVYIRHLMLEEGMIAHAYQPAPEDVQTYTQTQIKQTADAWNANLTSVKNGLTDKYTNLHATVDGIQAQVFDKNGSSKITHLSDLIATKVSQGDYNSQITQFKNDINLRVAKGNVVSQINQEAGGNTLIQVSNGKGKLALNASSVIFSGSAFIPDAYISTLNADKLRFYDSSGNVATMSAGLKQYDDDKTNHTVTLQYSGGYEVHASNLLGSILTMHDNSIRLAVKSHGNWASAPDQYSGVYVTTHYTQLSNYRSNGSAPGIYITDDGFTIKGDDTGNGTKYGDLNITSPQIYVTGGNSVSLSGSNAVQMQVNKTHAWLSDGMLHLYKDGDSSSTATELRVEGWAWVNGWVEAAGHSQHSALSTKTDIQLVDDDKMLKMVNDTDLATFLYKTDVANGETHRHIGLIIDDVHDVAQYQTPQDFIAPNGVSRDDDNMIGALFGAVKALTKRIKTLESKVG